MAGFSGFVNSILSVFRGLYMLFRIHGTVSGHVPIVPSHKVWHLHGENVCLLERYNKHVPTHCGKLILPQEELDLLQQ